MDNLSVFRVPQNHQGSTYFLIYVFCEVSIALENAMAMEVKSGMSQQRQRDSYISGQCWLLGYKQIW